MGAWQAVGFNPVVRGCRWGARANKEGGFQRPMGAWVLGGAPSRCKRYIKQWRVWSQVGLGFLNKLCNSQPTQRRGRSLIARKRGHDQGKGKQWQYAALRKAQVSEGVKADRKAWTKESA